MKRQFENACVDNYTHFILFPRQSNSPVVFSNVKCSSFSYIGHVHVHQTVVAFRKSSCMGINNDLYIGLVYRNLHTCLGVIWRLCDDESLWNRHRNRLNSYTLQTFRNCIKRSGYIPMYHQEQNCFVSYTAHINLYTI